MLKLFFSWTGRLNRARFWLVILVWWLIRIGVPYCFYLYYSYPAESLDINDVTVSPAVYESGMIFSRLHDFGASGWWVLLLLVPGVELIFTLIIGLIGSDRGTNRFGINPLGENNYYIPGANEEMRVRELKDLAMLYEKGLLTREEYDNTKARILKGQ